MLYLVRSTGSTGWSQGHDERTFRVQCLLKKAEWMRDAACPLIDVLETVMEARYNTHIIYRVLSLNSLLFNIYGFDLKVREIVHKLL